VVPTTTTSAPTTPAFQKGTCCDVPWSRRERVLQRRRRTLGWDYAPDGPADPYDDDGDYGDCDDCPWCASENRDDEDDVEYLCRSHLAEYEGLSENELDRRDAEEAADQL
jgi:hypothetical protein